MHRDSCPLDCKVYVGNLRNNENKTELAWAFGYNGPLRSVWVARNPPGFAFVEFEDHGDAADAVRELDGELTEVVFPLNTATKAGRCQILWNWSCEPPGRCWKLNENPLEEQTVL